MAEITFLGHASFLLKEKNKDILLFDPFIRENPSCSFIVEEIKADYILVSHGHFDHLGDSYEIARVNNSTIISTAEIVGEAEKNGLNAHPLHLGGKQNFPFGWVKATLAFHGSGIAGGHACGFLVNYYNKNIYFAGDTALFKDMELIGDKVPLDIALLPIGDNFTMGIDDAVTAAYYLQAKIVIPYHYNTWPLIEVDEEDFKRKLENTTSSQCIILHPGQNYQFK